MLRPEYIENLPNTLIELYSRVERDILADMARRISTYNFFIPAAEFQFQKLQDMGLLHDEIIKKLSRITGIAESEIRRLMEEAGAMALKTDDSIYRKAGLTPTPLDGNPALQAVLQSGIDRTSGLFRNLTKTTANTATKQFEDALDRSYMQISTGAFDYNSAIRTAVKDLSSKGVGVIRYPSDHTDYMEVAVRRATVTGINQTAAQLQEVRADEMGSDLVEVTAHAGARNQGIGPANHESWQGKVYSRSGTHPQYSSLVEKTGYGTGEGLCGWNCRHNFHPFFEGISEPAYTQADLDEMNAEKYTYNGQRMTEYDATQKQRYIERQIRRWKREEACMEAAGQPTDETKAKVAHWQGVQRDFIDQTGLKRQYGREQIGKITIGSAGLGAGSSSSGSKSVPKFIERIDASDSKLVESKLKEFEQSVVNEPIEHAYVILSNGKTYRFVGDVNGVDPTSLGKALEGSIVSHNHPVGSNNEYSFSSLDLDLFRDLQLKALRGFDELYEYEISKAYRDIEDPKPIFDLTEYDGMHEYVKREAKEMGAGYRRWRRE